MQLKQKDYQKIKTWIYRNARDIDLQLWKYFFEEGNKEEVVSALRFYQNEDGGFGNALEPDCWNPDSSPYTTLFALNILLDLEYFEFSDSIYTGIIRYFSSGKEMEEYGWRFSVPSNDGYGRAPWMTYNEDSNKKESLGVTAGISCFFLNSPDKNSEMCQKALNFTKIILDKAMKEDDLGELGIGAISQLLFTAQRLNLEGYDYTALMQGVHDLVNHSIERDTSNWKFYGVRPSNYIRSPQSIFYAGNENIVQQELDYLMETIGSDGVWGITWSWFDNYEKYPKEFALSENWWKAGIAIKNLRLLQAFDCLETVS